MRSRKNRKTTLASMNNGSIGCGVDVVEIPRFRQVLRRGGKAFIKRIFTKNEVAYADARSRTRVLHLAGRFAVKEAVIKAVAQIDPKQVLHMNQIEVRNDKLGRPCVVMHWPKKTIKQKQSIKTNSKTRRSIDVHISISHVNSVAVASAFAIR